jgi:hypothetical protein
MTIEQWKSVLGLAESFAKIAALIVGGSWTYLLFIKKRTAFPRAEVVHTCAAYPIDGQRSVLRVTLTVKNKSDVLLQIISGRVLVQQIAPFADAAAELPMGFAGQGDTFEYSWPPIGDRVFEYASDRYLEVEPGESDAIDFDVFIEGTVRVVQIYSYLKNVTKKNRELGWNCTSIHRLTPAAVGERSVE